MSPRLSDEARKQPAPRRLLRCADIAIALLLTLAAVMAASSGLTAREHEAARDHPPHARVMLPAYSHSGPLETVEPDDVVDGLVIGRDPAPFSCGAAMARAELVEQPTGRAGQDRASRRKSAKAVRGSTA